MDYFLVGKVYLVFEMAYLVLGNIIFGSKAGVFDTLNIDHDIPAEGENV